MRRHIVLLMLLVASTRIMAAQSAASASRLTPEIAAMGTGTVRLKSDRASVAVAVVTRANSAAAAGRLNAQQFQLVFAALKRQRLADSAITTTGYSVMLEQDATGRAPAGPAAPRQYVARNAIGVALTNPDLIGQVLDTALAAGATEITNITFASSQAAVARERAIGLAVRAAQSDAAAAATAAGGTLGPMIELSLIEDYGYASTAAVVVSDSANDGLAGTPLRARDVSVSMRVRVRYAFVPRA